MFNIEEEIDEILDETHAVPAIDLAGGASASSKKKKNKKVGKGKKDDKGGADAVARAEPEPVAAEVDMSKKRKSDGPDLRDKTRVPCNFYEGGMHT